MFGTYVRRGELLVYPFFEYYVDDNYEYKPSEFGFTPAVDYRGRYRASEGRWRSGAAWSTAVRSRNSSGASMRSSTCGACRVPGGWWR